MDETILRVILIALATWTLCLTFTYAILWSKLRHAEDFTQRHLSRVEGLVDVLEGKVPEARLQEMEATLVAFRTRLDTGTLENEAFRAKVHKSMQRFNTIMVRNENAILSKAEKALTDPNNSDTPDEIPLGDVRPPEHQGKPSRAELRALLRAKRTE